jgi:hypothetical protein
MIALDDGDKIQGDTTTASKVDYTLHGVVGKTITQLADGQLPSSTGDLYTSGADATVVAGIVLVNTNTSAESINLFLLPSGGTARRILPKDMSLGAAYSCMFDGNTIATIDADGQLVNSFDITSLFLTEQAAAQTDVAGDGQVWVKNVTPNELWFTDDAGNDTQLTGNGGSSSWWIDSGTSTYDLEDYSVIVWDLGAA